MSDRKAPPTVHIKEQVVAALLAKARDERADPADVFTKEAGIFCPHQGPDKELWCQVYKNWSDYQEWGEEGHATFCRRHCQFGRNPEVARRNREIRDRRRGLDPGWRKALPTTAPMFHPAVKAAGPPKAYQKPKRGRRLP